jgi:ADP-dependent NAD(P)H-hydrate dehydratase
MSQPFSVDAEYLRDWPLPAPREGSKDDRGRILILAGSAEVAGAALLAGLGALRAGAGKLQIATVASRAPFLGFAMPEALVMALPETAAGGIAPGAAEVLTPRVKRCDAFVIGPGMVQDEDTHALTRDLVCGTPEIPCVIDAAAMCDLLPIADRIGAREVPAILTPHAGEMAQLLNARRSDIEADPVTAARDVARQLNAVVIMKGATTCIADPGGSLWHFSGGSVGLGTSGSGDTLAGIIGGLLARGVEPVRAAVWGVYLHGEAGRRLARAIGTLGFLAREIPDQIPGILDGFQTV